MWGLAELPLHHRKDGGAGYMGFCLMETDILATASGCAQRIRWLGWQGLV